MELRRGAKNVGIKGENGGDDTLRGSSNATCPREESKI